MAELTIAMGFVALLSVASIWADRRFRNQGHLPMQWSFRGKVNWTAPRRIALALTPALGALILGGVAVQALVGGTPRPGQEDLGVPVIFLAGVIIVAAHAVHLWMIERTVR